MAQEDGKEPNLIPYQESHDEERVMWETLNFGSTSPINLKDLENAVNRNQLLTAFYFGIPGPKMIWQFGEFGYDVELNNDRLAIKPTRWNYLDNPERQRLFQLYQEMIKLKKENPVFSKSAKTTLSLGGNSEVHYPGKCRYERGNAWKFWLIKRR